MRKPMENKLNRSEVVESVKVLLVSHLMLQGPSAALSDSQVLFGPGGLGLDSVDALQLVVAVEKEYGLKIPDSSQAKDLLRSVDSLCAAVHAHLVAAGRAV